MDKKKRIGIITFSNTKDNYGQVLQYLATQDYLDGRGHETFLFIPQGHKVTIWNRLVHKTKKIGKKILKFLPAGLTDKESDALTRPLSISALDEQKQSLFERWAVITEWNEKQHPRHFGDFRRSFFHTHSCYYEDLKDVYAFAIGSDQMWSYISEDTMLSFVRGNIKRFSIAPSVGHKVFNEDEIKIAAPALAKFDFITVREQNGLDFCKACGRIDAHLVLDPTFLIPKKSYQKYANLQRIQVPKRYVMIYMLGGEIEPSIEDMFKWAKERELEVVYVASQGRDDEHPKCYATVEQWLALLQNAEYVFTNSYHGMALSVIYHKQFITFPLIGLMEGMNGRIVQLAENFSLQGRIYQGDLNAVTKQIDWEIAEKTIEKNINLLDKLLKTVDL